MTENENSRTGMADKNYLNLARKGSAHLGAIAVLFQEKWMGKRKMIYKRQEPPGYTKCEPLGYTGELLGYTKLRYQNDRNLQHIQ